MSYSGISYDELVIMYHQLDADEFDLALEVYCNENDEDQEDILDLLSNEEI